MPAPDRRSPYSLSRYSSFAVLVFGWMLLAGWILNLAACAPKQNRPCVPELDEGTSAQVEYHDQDGNTVGVYKRSFALLIGVGDATAGSPERRSIPSDLNAVSTVLRQHGFGIQKVLNPDRACLKTSFENFISRYGHDKENRLLFFVAGRGYTDGRTGYLAAADAPDPKDNESDFKKNALSLTTIIDWARQNIEANHALFLFDSSLPGRGFETEQRTNRLSPLDDLTTRKVRQFITAGSDWEKEPTTSVFVPTLVRALEGKADFNRDGFVTGTELGEYARQELFRGDFRLTPQYGKLSDPDLDRRGEVVFRLPSDLDTEEREYLRKMAEKFAEVEMLGLSASEMGTAWSDFLRDFAMDVPLSEEDEELRQNAEMMLTAWRRQIEPANQPDRAVADPLPGPVVVDRQPDPAATDPLPDPAVVEPQPVEPQPVAVDPQPVAVDPQPVAVEPQPVAVEPQPVAVDSQPVAVDPQPVAGDPSHAPGAVDSLPGSAVVHSAVKVDSSLLRKVVGLSDNIPILDAPGSSTVVDKMETLKPYFVLEKVDSSYRISDRQEESDVSEFVAEKKVAEWNTREGLRFQGGTFSENRRAVVAAWETEERIRRYAETGDEKNYGPTFREPAQTRVGTDDIIPYPLLGTKEIVGRDGTPRRIHQVLIPAIVAGTVETELTPEQVQAVAGAMTFCIVFDATASMGKYAKAFANTIDQMLTESGIDTGIAAAGFVLFRDIKDSERFEIVQPMPLKDAMDWLRGRVRHMEGGDDPAEPVLDAMILAQNSFLWNGGTAIRGAKRVALVVANKDAKLQTVDLSRDGTVEKDLNAVDVGRRLLKDRISVFTLQAGFEDRGHLVETLTTLALETGGEFYAAERSRKISQDFSVKLKGLVKQRVAAAGRASDALTPHVAARAQGGTVIALRALDPEMRERLKAAAKKYHISGGGLIIHKAWLFEQSDLYREEILIEKELLEKLVRFFGVLTDSTLDAPSLRDSMKNVLAALTGENLSQSDEVQELLEKELGIHFTTNLLSFELEKLATLSAEERLELQENIRTKAEALADFLDRMATRFNKEPRIWMPVDLLP